MRTSALDNALSTGLEGFDAPPSAVVEASAVDLENQTAIVTSLAAATAAETDLTLARQSIADLTRLGNGLEGLMIEVTRVDKANDPTSEELAALRVAAMTVRRELLTDDERRLVDEIGEGRLEGSVEGLGDLMKNVGTKLGFAIGNFWDGVKRNFGGSSNALAKIDTKLDQLIARMKDLPDVTYERTLVKDDAVMFALDGKIDAAAVLADLPGAIDDWFYRPMMLLVDQIEKMSSDLQTTLHASSEEEYNNITESSADLYKLQVPENSKKVDVINGKHFIFDLYDVHRSYGDRQRTVYIARPNHNTDINSLQYDNALATGVSFANITLLRGSKAQPAKVTFTKEQLLNGLLQLQRTVKDMAAYIKQQDVAVKAYRNYARSTDNYENFTKQSFVTKVILHRVSIQAGAILSLFEMALLPVNAVVADIDKMTDILKSFVYSSDLSKG
jgi:hypothetical protein